MYAWEEEPNTSARLETGWFYEITPGTLCVACDSDVVLIVSTGDVVKGIDWWEVMRDKMTIDQAFEMCPQYTPERLARAQKLARGWRKG